MLFHVMTNGCRISIEKSVFNKKQKSMDVMINNGKDNNWYKIGIIKDVETLKQFFESEVEDE